MPASAATVTLKCSVPLPPPVITKLPLHVSTCAATDGSLVVSPDDVPAVYANPAGSVSATDVTVTSAAFGFAIVIVYPSDADAAAVAASAVFVTTSGCLPSGEYVVRCEIAAEAPAPSVRSHSSAAPLSSAVAQSHVSGSEVFAPIAAHTSS